MHFARSVSEKNPSISSDTPRVHKLDANHKMFVRERQIYSLWFSVQRMVWLVVGGGAVGGLPFDDENFGNHNYKFESSVIPNPEDCQRWAVMDVYQWILSMGGGQCFF